eukprot:1183850-Prorocentrum_minimum.AAC.2
MLYQQMGKADDALPLCQRSLAVMEKVYGSDHPSVALSLNNLANVYDTIGEYDDALPLYQRSLAICEKVYEAEHPSVATGLQNLGLLYYKMGSKGDARPLFERAVAVNERVLGKEHPETVMMRDWLDGWSDDDDVDDDDDDDDQGDNKDNDDVVLSVDLLVHTWGVECTLAVIGTGGPSQGANKATTVRLLLTTVKARFERLRGLKLKASSRTPGKRLHTSAKVHICVHRKVACKNVHVCHVMLARRVELEVAFSRLKTISKTKDLDYPSSTVSNSYGGY